MIEVRLLFSYTVLKVSCAKLCYPGCVCVFYTEIQLSQGSRGRWCSRTLRCSRNSKAENRPKGGAWIRKPNSSPHPAVSGKFLRIPTINTHSLLNSTKKAVRKHRQKLGKCVHRVQACCCWFLLWRTEQMLCVVNVLCSNRTAVGVETRTSSSTPCQVLYFLTHPHIHFTCVSYCQSLKTYVSLGSAKLLSVLSDSRIPAHMSVSVC